MLSQACNELNAPTSRSTGTYLEDAALGKRALTLHLRITHPRHGRSLANPHTTGTLAHTDRFISIFKSLPFIPTGLGKPSYAATHATIITLHTLPSSSLLHFTTMFVLLGGARGCGNGATARYTSNKNSQEHRVVAGIGAA